MEKSAYDVTCDSEHASSWQPEPATANLSSSRSVYEPAPAVVRFSQSVDGAEGLLVEPPAGIVRSIM